ncbi:MAG: Malto-oligosyltrehalose trehalohydrolase [Chroococcidiopsis cubana SAG 39.79]|nr:MULTISPECIES: malto-oligosyltrehalose trehalohydrolase [Chroococcidiopsis]MDZ4874337.1 Malto-oligosyltrehalose trehalohydrolase [Chroococcidiopsis cubana SAG 39.79]RUT13931.1 malto-oligosyltrehalose trehalohydrolase [Chroococcidiopsis cubana SAG 39.79]URD51901.1 malto-oligosyltrehalose trehalohydrolase [Chroococcidiopsis sp. CCNUC1]
MTNDKFMKIGANYLGGDRCEFIVWGPNIESLGVQIVSPEERFLQMEQEDGYWKVVADNIPPGTQYLLELNGGETRPDPASYFQPHGVHKPSQVISHEFTWNDGDWAGVPLDAMIIYELHVGTFTPEGTFTAIIPRLADLKELGVNAIEIMPIAQFPGNIPPDGSCAYRNWGYDGVYPFAVQNSYGTPEELKQLVAACHQQGISVILDVVYNHFGPEGNYTSNFAPYFTQTYRTPWGSAINFDDAHSHDVRHFFIENALYWLREFHIDGLRLDAVHAIYDLGAKHFLAELAEKVREFSERQGRKYYLIAESDLNDPKIIRPKEVGGYELDAQWSDDFHHALHALLTGDSDGYYQDFGKCEDLAKAYRDTFVYDWKYAPHRQRFHGSSARDRTDLAQFVVCIQNHDQIGNQLLGERLSKLISFDALKLAAGAVILSPYIPLLFMGEEYAEEAPFTYFVSHSDPDLIKAVREGRKQEFAAFHAVGDPPDPESSKTFLGCKMDWEKRQEGKHQVIWSWYQKLIQLRTTVPALIKKERNSIEAGADEQQKIVWWRRWSDDSQILCLMNFNQNDVSFAPELSHNNWQKILDSADEKWQGSGTVAPDKINSGEEIKLRSYNFVLYENT